MELGSGNTGVPGSNGGSVSDTLMVPESGTKDPEGKVRFEAGEVCYLWNNKESAAEKCSLSPTNESALTSVPEGGPRDRGLPGSNPGCLPG